MLYVITSCFILLDYFPLCVLLAWNGKIFRPVQVTPDGMFSEVTKYDDTLLFLWSYKKECYLYTGCPGGERARFREIVPYITVHRSNPKHLYPKLNGCRDNGERKVWPSCGSTYCTCFACCYRYTMHVRPLVSQPS